LIDESYLELIKLADLLSKERISVNTALRFFRTMLENNTAVLSELKVMDYVEN